MDLVEQCPGNSESIRIVWKTSFNGRRAEILSGKYVSIQDVLKECCPVLNQTIYVRFYCVIICKTFSIILMHRLFQLQGELDDGTCKKFLENWRKLVPKIIKVGLTSSSQNVKSVLKYYDGKEGLKNTGKYIC